MATSIVQDSQAKISQFFNFIGSTIDDAQAASRTLVNVSASSSQIPNSVPEKYPETQCEPGYYTYPFDGTKKMINDNPLVKEIERKELQKVMEEVSSTFSPSSNTISPLEEARIRKEVRDMMNQQFAQARAKLESNPVAHVNISKSYNATADVDIIDLISQSVGLAPEIAAIRLTWFPNLGSQYPFPCWEWWERSRIFAFIV